MPLDPWICTIASDLVFGTLAWIHYERGWQLEEGWLPRRFWLTAALPALLFSAASFLVTSTVTR